MGTGLRESIDKATSGSGEGNTETGEGGTPLNNGGSNKSIPDANIIIWDYPKDNYYNSGDRPKATPEQMKKGDTAGGNPDKNIYPKK